MITPGPLAFYQCPRCARSSWSAHDIQYGYCKVCQLCQAHATMRPTSFPPIWTVHARPEDYPEHYVVRVSWGPWHEARVQLAGTLELARLAVRMEGACFCLGRFAEDDPKILECWV